jgi:hypothetical protein
LMTKKVDKTFHEREIWAVKKLARRALSLLLALNAAVRVARAAARHTIHGSGV